MAIGGTDEARGHRLVADHTIYAAVVGSRAFGLAVEDSDTDVRGVYVAPTDSFWSLIKPPTHVDGPGAQTFSWKACGGSGSWLTAPTPRRPVHCGRTVVS